MIRTQIQLTEEQSREIRSIAERENTSMANLIRRAVDDWLARYSDTARRARKKRALEVAGRYRSGLSDVSEHHDEYLAEAYGDYESRDDLR
jgi:hypothetical protein